MKDYLTILSALLISLYSCTAPAHAHICQATDESLATSLPRSSSVVLGTLEEVSKRSDYIVPKGMLDGNTGRPGRDYRFGKFKIDKVLFGKNSAGAKISLKEIYRDVQWSGTFQNGDRFILVLNESDSPLTVIPANGCEKDLPAAKNLFDLERLLVKILTHELSVEKNAYIQILRIEQLTPIMTPVDELAIVPFLHSKEDETKRAAESHFEKLWSKFKNRSAR